MNKIRLITSVGLLSSACLLLTACDENWMTGDYYNRSYRTVDVQQPMPFQGEKQRYAHRPVVVKPGYHFSDRHTPESFQNRDTDWAGNQSGQDYTIEISNDEKPSTVARSLIEAPKLERSAQLKYQEGGKTRYTGVYGTYKSREDAERALSKLPPNLRNNAKIKSWQNVQGKHQAEQQNMNAEPIQETPQNNPIETQENPTALPNSETPTSNGAE